jgi:hypothetical protein
MVIGIMVNLLFDINISLPIMICPLLVPDQKTSLQIKYCGLMPGKPGKLILIGANYLT